VAVGLIRASGRALLHGALNDIIGRKWWWWTNLMSSEIGQWGLRKITKSPSRGKDSLICDFLNIKQVNEWTQANKHHAEELT
jgi:hypothetical protein